MPFHNAPEIGIQLAGSDSPGTTLSLFSVVSTEEATGLFREGVRSLFVLLPVLMGLGLPDDVEELTFG